MTAGSLVLGAALCLLPLVAFAGDEVCASCHPTESSNHLATPMAQALYTVAACDILKKHPDMSFQEGKYKSRIVREGDRSILTVTAGSETFTIPLLWAFGRGRAGQTFAFRYQDAWYESRLSFFDQINALDLTMGAANSQPQNILEAAGRHMGVMEERQCFGCHSNGGVSDGKLHIEAMAPGVGCQSCHTDTEKHAKAMLEGGGAPSTPPHLAGMSAEDAAELCGSCHRTWSQIALSGPRGVNNVRFQPYRLVNSKCYDATDRRISCMTCHEPHSLLEKNSAVYDAKCKACHSAALHAKVCSVGKEKCAGCHMPKLDLPGAHALFTDHQIRIVRAGDTYPN
jgi:hypothetical protein